MSSVNPQLAFDHLPYLIDQAHRRMQRDLAQLVDSRRFPELRGAHMKILSMIPSEGTRPSALASTANMTRPALGEIVAHLREHGYVTVKPDPADGRAVIVVHTARGRKAYAAADKGITELRRHWATQIGEDAVAALERALTALAVEQAPPG